MPAELLERPAEIEESCDLAKIRPAVRQTILRVEQKPPTRQRAETLWQKIFKGREEYLGWTPE